MRAIEQPGAQYAVIDQRQPLADDAFAVEWVRAQAALAQRIVDDADAVGEKFLSHLVAQETRLARDRGAIGGAGQMPDDRAGDARIEHHRHLARRYLARIDPLDGALAGSAPDFFRALQIGRMQRGRIIVIALHAGALAGDRRHRQRVTRAEIGAVKAVAGDQHHAADARRSGRAARLGDAFNGESRTFRGARRCFQPFNRRQVRIEQVEVGKIMRQQARVGEACELVLRRRARHRHRAFGQRLGAVGGQIVRGDNSLAAADQHAQTEIVTLGAFAFFHRAVAHLDRQGNRAHRHRVGGIGAGGAGGFHQALGALGEGGLIEKRRRGGTHERVNAFCF